MDIDLNSLISHLGTDAHSVLEGSSSKCVSRGGYEITIEDFLLELLETPDNEFKKIHLSYSFIIIIIFVT